MHRIDIPEWAVQRGQAVNDFRRADPARTALLVIDLQNFFMVPGQPMANPHAVDIVPNVNALTDAMRRAGGHVLFTQHSFEDVEPPHRLAPPGDPNSAFVRDLCGMLRPGAFSYALHEGLQVDPRDILIKKWRASAFHPYALTNLRDVLDERDIETLVITGCVTNGCCETTARDAHSFNYKVIVVADATAALTDEEHNAALLNLRLYFADVQRTEETLRLFA